MHQKHEIAAKIITLVKAQLEELSESPVTTDIDPLSSFEDLGFDWLAMTHFMMEVEQEFSIIINEKDAQSCINVQSVIDYLSNQS